MAYQEDIPKVAPYTFGTGVTDVNTNFNALDDIFAINHIAFTDTTGDYGKHLYTVLQKAATDPETAQKELAVFNKKDANVHNLFYREVDNGKTQQWTGFVTAAADGEVPLPGGLSMKWGSASVDQNGLTFTLASVGLHNFPREPFVAISTRGNHNDIMLEMSATATTITMKTNGGLVSNLFYWMVIG